MPFKTLDSVKNLQQGDIVVSKVTSITYVVTGNYGDRVTAVKTVDITNPSEWWVVETSQENITVSAIIEQINSLLCKIRNK